MNSNEENKIFIKVDNTSKNYRLDKYLTIKTNLSRSLLKKYIEDELVFVNKKNVKASYNLLDGDEIVVNLPEPKCLDIKPENISIDIVYEDSDIIIVNKGKNMVVHPSNGHYTNTLVNALLYYLKDNLSTINGVLRPGIVHRIDKDTTGVLVVCKNDKAHNFIANQLKEHSIKRIYHAIVSGNLKEDGTVCAPIGRDKKDRKKMAVVELGGKKAITHYKIIENFKGYTHIACQLETGRTHQIRVHMASIGHPVLADEMYGGNNKSVKMKLNGQCLHAKTIGFIHPSTGKYVEFDSNLPKYFENLINLLRKL